MTNPSSESNMTDHKPFTLLTQDNCPNCDRLKLMLRGPLKGQFDSQIQTVHRQSQPEAFEALTAQHHIQSVPALIDAEGRVMVNLGGLGEVKAFLQRGVTA